MVDNRNETAPGGATGMGSDRGQQQDQTIQTDRQQNQQGGQSADRDLDQDSDANFERDADEISGGSIDNGNMGSGTGSADR